LLGDGKRERGKKRNRGPEKIKDEEEALVTYSVRVKRKEKLQIITANEKKRSRYLQRGEKETKSGPGINATRGVRTNEHLEYGQATERGEKIMNKGRGK